LGTMFHLPIASSTLDYVFCCEVLHHNDRETLQRTFDEAYRVLAPSGQLLVINETMKFPFNLKRDHAREVAEFEGYEHTYFFHQYYLAARRAGFRVRVLEPRYHPVFTGSPISLTPGLSLGTSAQLPAAHLIRKPRLLRLAYPNYRNLLRGDVPPTLLCSKACAAGPTGPTSSLACEQAGPVVGDGPVKGLDLGPRPLPGELPDRGQSG